MSLYKKAKKILSIIIPRSILFRYEYFLRSFYYIWFIGDKFQCNICGKKIKSFVSIDEDKLCPRCGSLQRTRRLWHILTSEFLTGNPKILDFSPSRSIYRVLKRSKYDYVSSDLSGNFLSDVAYDITNIYSEDRQYDLIICYHILEHIDNDQDAMKEIHRVLKKDGFCLIQTPFKAGEIYEDPSITTPAAREKHFGQFDHVRIYSVKGLTNRLKSVGFQVDIREFSEPNENIHGFSEKETLIVCKRIN